MSIRHACDAECSFTVLSGPVLRPASAFGPGRSRFRSSLCRPGTVQGFLTAPESSTGTASIDRKKEFVKHVAEDNCDVKIEDGLSDTDRKVREAYATSDARKQRSTPVPAPNPSERALQTHKQSCTEGKSVPFWAACQLAEDDVLEHEPDEARAWSRVAAMERQRMRARDRRMWTPRRRGSCGRPRSRARRSPRASRAGPSGSSDDGPGEPGDEEPLAGRRKVRPPSVPGRAHRRIAPLILAASAGVGA